MSEKLCECINWARDPSSENRGVYPLSDHHYNCDKFKLESFAKLESGGTSCIMEIKEAVSILFDEETEEEYKISKVLLTRDQFDRLPEFNGF